MKIKSFPSANDVANHAYKHVQFCIDSTTFPRLMLPTGNTPLQLYKLLSNSILDFNNVTTFNLDEYYPIKRNHPDSYWTFMHNELFNNINIDPENINILNPEVNDIENECNEYEKRINNNIDLCILGIGRNGHIAFNEPDSHSLISSKTRLVTLTPQTININNIDYKTALTVGINTIMQSKKIIMIITGDNKKDIVYDLLYKNLFIPAHYILSHPNHEIILDDKSLDKVYKELPLFVNNDDKIMIFSPHPDDDVIGMGATIYKLFKFGIKVKIVYQTSGKGGGDVRIRQQEAISAIKSLGGTEDNIIFLNLPFYEKKFHLHIDGIIGNLEIKPDQFDIIKTFQCIEEYNPNKIFFAGDICDPNKTHKICYDILHNISKVDKRQYYLYYSAWDTTENPDDIHIFNKDTMDKKIYSIKQHESQINPRYKGELKDEFYKEIFKRNKKDGFGENCFVEKFKLL